MSAAVRAEAVTWRLGCRRAWRRAIRQAFQVADAERQRQRWRAHRPSLKVTAEPDRERP